MAHSSLQTPPFHSRPQDPANFIRILAIADVDLHSVSELAEYALRQEYERDLALQEETTTSGETGEDLMIGGGRVDLCLAIGPFDSPSYERKYGRNEQYRNPHMRRSREEEAAAEGTMTAAILQLETIVCRVCFIPGNTDPSTIYGMPHLEEQIRKVCGSSQVSSSEIWKEPHKRLTPNSRNVHNRWFQLAPDLGCIGLSDCYTPDEQNGSNDGIPTYVERMGSLLRLAPPSTQTLQKPDGKFSPSQDLSQTIAISHFYQYHHLTAEESLQGSIEVKIKNDDSMRPWPESYTKFLASSKADQQIVLNLIGSVIPFDGHDPNCNTAKEINLKIGQPFEMQHQNIRIVAPGSLRKNGDFALIDLVLACNDETNTNFDEKSLINDVENQADIKRTRSQTGEQRENTFESCTKGNLTKTKPCRRWQVHRVKFCSMHRSN